MEPMRNMQQHIASAETMRTAAYQASEADPGDLGTSLDAIYCVLVAISEELAALRRAVVAAANLDQRAVI